MATTGSAVLVPPSEPHPMWRGQEVPLEETQYQHDDDRDHEEQQHADQAGQHERQGRDQAAPAFAGTPSAAPPRRCLLPRRPGGR